MYEKYTDEKINVVKNVGFLNYYIWEKVSYVPAFKIKSKQKKILKL